MRRATISKLLALMGLVGLPLLVWACVGPREAIPDFPGTGEQIRRLYEARAMERGGICTVLRLEQITQSRVVSRSDDRLVLDVRYFYRPVSDPFPQTGTCKDFESRQFTFARNGDGWTLLGMDGEQR